jgi:hypothetical protein
MDCSAEIGAYFTSANVDAEYRQLGAADAGFIAQSLFHLPTQSSVEVVAVAGEP